MVRGQFRGYRKEKGVAPDSKVETFAAVKLAINSWRWQGVPFYIRAGKCLPVTATEVIGRLRRPPWILPGDRPPPNYVRFRLSPDVAIALGTMVMNPGEVMTGGPQELLACQRSASEKVDPYERLLGDAMKGDATLFAREDYVEEAWRIVGPILGNVTPLYEYDCNTWGPPAMEDTICPSGGWVDPVPAC